MDRPKKLYYKDEKGRYREYQEPEPPFDNALYRKMLHGKKVVYEPVSMLQDRDLGEGVWVVVKNIYGKSYSNGKYLNDCFMCLKARITPAGYLGMTNKKHGRSVFHRGKGRKLLKNNSSIRYGRTMLTSKLFTL